MKITILGSGTSTGVPEIGCTCPVCTSSDPRDHRLRASALIETDDTRILIDCGPDFRTQVLGLPFKKIDGVLITHEHYDHVGGLVKYLFMLSHIRRNVCVPVCLTVLWIIVIPEFPIFRCRRLKKIVLS